MWGRHRGDSDVSPDGSAAGHMARTSRASWRCWRCPRPTAALRAIMRILGIDLGEKTIGVAVSDELALTAQALKTIRRRGIRRDLEALGAVIKEYDVEQIVIGLPRNMNGSLGPSAERAMEFVNRLRVFNLPVVTEDERLTSVIAEKALIEGDVRRARRRQVINQMAAALILQGYLDRLSRERGHEN